MVDIIEITSKLRNMKNNEWHSIIDVENEYKIYIKNLKL